MHYLFLSIVSPFVFLYLKALRAHLLQDTSHLQLDPAVYRSSPHELGVTNLFSCRSIWPREMDNTLSHSFTLFLLLVYFCFKAMFLGLSFIMASVCILGWVIDYYYFQLFIGLVAFYSAVWLLYILLYRYFAQHKCFYFL